LKPLQQYIIPYSGLKTGKHNFDFQVSQAFFDEFEYSLVKNGDVKVDLELEKQETMLILSFHIKGDIHIGCDVCLSDFPYKMDVHERQIVKFTGDENLEDDTEEIILLPKNENEIDVSSLIYEYITVSVPYISRCDDEGNTEWCDKDMIRKIGELSGSNNEENTTDADPRWDALKNLKK
jgi:uncharacterized metal-binding protein YceD (DUF177 family)